MRAFWIAIAAVWAGLVVANVAMAVRWLRPAVRSVTQHYPSLFFGPVLLALLSLVGLWATLGEAGLLP